VPYREEGRRARHHDHDQPRAAQRALRAGPKSPCSVGDLWSALEHDEDFSTAERLGLEFSEDFELLKDIGWAKGDGRTEFEIRMPEHDLMEQAV
jgi:hypothetical protein